MTRLHLLGLAITVLVTSACAPSALETENQRKVSQEEAQEAAWDALDDQPVWTATVVGYDGLLDDMLMLDYGGEYEARADLAHVQPLRECQYGDIQADAAYTQMIHRRLPIGSRIAWVRSQEKDGRLMVEDKGLAHFLDPAGAPLLEQPSLNEEMVRDGVAVPDPDVDMTGASYATPVEEVLSAERGRLSDLDFAYWSTFVRLYQRAWARGTGVAGACALEMQEQAREDERSREESARRARDYENGPDGIKGTYDDWTRRGEAPRPATGSRRSCDGDGDGVCYE